LGGGGRHPGAGGGRPRRGAGGRGGQHPGRALPPLGPLPGNVCEGVLRWSWWWSTREPAMTMWWPSTTGACGGGQARGCPWGGPSSVGCSAGKRLGGGAEMERVVEHPRACYADVVAGDDVSLRVETGQVVAIVGPNGCGKSTLLRAIARLHRPARGRVLLD